MKPIASLASSFLTLSALAIAAVGCSSGDPDGEGGGGDDAAQPFDLESCELLLACDAILRHIDVGPQSALECAGAFIASGARGPLRATDAPGPGPGFVSYRMYVVGDGTAIAQRKECPDVDCSDPVLGPHERCELAGYEALQISCGASVDDPGCSWNPFGALVNCESIDEQTCATLPTFTPEGGE